MDHNIFSITCDSCSETAYEFDNDAVSRHTIDGKVCPCQSCSVLGRISYDYEYERSSVRFYPLTENEVSEVDFGDIVDAYEAGQKKIDSLICEVCEERAKSKEKDALIAQLQMQLNEARKVFEGV